MNAIIVDDESHSGNVLRADLKINCPKVYVVEQFEDSRLALNWLQTNTIDLVFLDVMMPHMTGIQLLESLQPLNFNVIFTTAYNQYASRAFRLSAIDFLEKPIEAEELKQAVQKVDSLINKNIEQEQLKLLKYNFENHQMSNRLALPSNKGFEFVTIDDIIYLESDGNFCWVYFRNKKKIHVTKLLKQMELTLLHHSFCRIHHKYLINLGHLLRYERGDGGLVVLTEGMELAVSRERKTELMEKLML